MINMIWDMFLLALNNIRRRGIRSILTVIGIFIGIAAITSLITLSQGLQNAFDQSFSRLGTDKLFVKPGTSSSLMPIITTNNNIILDSSDVSTISKVNHVSMAIGIISASTVVKYKQTELAATINSLPSNSQEINMLESTYFPDIASGRNMMPNDHKVAIIGHGLLSKLKGIKSGQTISINGQEFKIIGIYEQVGNPQVENTITIDKASAKSILDFSKIGYSQIIVQVQKGYDIDTVKDAITKAERKHRNVNANTQNFTVTSSTEILNAFKTILSILQVMIVGIASISLIVGGIGILNNMYTSVMERTKRIGTLKAIGARNSDILTLFFFESGLLGTIGGIVGIAVGLGIAYFVEYYAIMSGFTLLVISINWALVSEILMFSFSLGVIFGLLPAFRASKMKPSVALRYE